MKKRTTVSIDDAVLLEARALGINLSRALETALKGLLSERRRAAWRRDNADALAAYNRHIAEDRIFGRDKRRF